LTYEDAAEKERGKYTSSNKEYSINIKIMIIAKAFTAFDRRHVTPVDSPTNLDQKQYIKYDN
jgi:hypothetical protein